MDNQCTDPLCLMRKDLFDALCVLMHNYKIIEEAHMNSNGETSQPEPVHSPHHIFF